MKRTILLAFISLTAISTFAQKTRIIDLSLLVKKKPITSEMLVMDTIPIAIERGKIVIMVETGEAQRRFIFDTGSPSILSEKAQSQIPYKHIRDGKLSDMSNSDNVFSIVEVNEMRIGKTELKGVPMLTYDVYTPEHRAKLFSELAVDGIIGSNILKGLMVKIDLRKKHLIFTNDKEVFKAESKQYMPVSFNEQGLPFVNVQPFVGMTDRVMVDTGNENNYAIKESTLKDFINRKEILNDQVADSYFTTNEEEAVAQDSVHLLALEQFTINRITLRDLPAVSINSHSSRLGLKLLEHGTMILDCINNRFVYTTYNNETEYNIPEAIYDLNLVYEAPYYKVGMIWKNSAAYKSGIRKDDKIVSINGKQLDADAWYALWNTKDGNTGQFKVKLIDARSNAEKECTLNYKP